MTRDATSSSRRGPGRPKGRSRGRVAAPACSPSLRNAGKWRSPSCPWRQSRPLGRATLTLMWPELSRPLAAGRVLGNAVLQKQLFKTVAGGRRPCRRAPIENGPRSGASSKQTRAATRRSCGRVANCRFLSPLLIIARRPGKNLKKEGSVPNCLFRGRFLLFLRLYR